MTWGYSVSGYRHPAYCHSLSEFGAPTLLPGCEGWMLTRNIPGSELQDAMGCYPLFTCEHWDSLPADLAGLRDQLVSVVLVTDPFGNFDAGTLQQSFDLFVPFKEHFVVDSTKAPESYVAPHHQRNVRKSLALVDVELCSDPTMFTNEWIALYRQLIARHDIRGLTRFSDWSLGQQLLVPGLVMFRAVHGDATAGLLLWYEQDDVAYYHLAAYTEAGYEARASFALFDAAIRHFRPRVRWLALGAGAGIDSAGSDGLTRFKRGWSTDTRPTYLAGRVLDPVAYESLANLHSTASASYFPQYRAGEFA